MKYALLVYSDQSAWLGMSEEEALAAREASMPKWIALFEELAKVDPGVDGSELEAAADARTVRVRSGERLVTDGPFAETKELIGGIFILEAPDLDEVIRLAALIPAAEYGSIEVRPIVEH